MKNWLVVLLVSPFLLSGCVGAIVGAGATAGIAASQEGGVERAWTDAKIQGEINRLWFEKDIEMFRKLDMTVNEGRVLITGIVQDPEARVEAVRLAWKPPGVKQVINEIRVADSTGVTGFARDTWITTRLRSAITFNRNIYSINYSIDTVQGTVYLMGVAQNQQELNRVIETARTIPDVKQVVSYVKVLNKKPKVVKRKTDDVTVKNSGDSPDNLHAETWSDAPSSPDGYSGGYNDSSGGPVELVPQPVESEQLN